MGARETRAGGQALQSSCNFSYSSIICTQSPKLVEGSQVLYSGGYLHLHLNKQAPSKPWCHAATRGCRCRVGCWPQLRGFGPHGAAAGEARDAVGEPRQLRERVWRPRRQPDPAALRLAAHQRLRGGILFYLCLASGEREGSSLGVERARRLCDP